MTRRLNIWIGLASTIAVFYVSHASAGAVALHVPRAASQATATHSESVPAEPATIAVGIPSRGSAPAQPSVATTRGSAAAPPSIATRSNSSIGASASGVTPVEQLRMRRRLESPGDGRGEIAGVATTPSASSFHWGEVGIGAGAMFALILLALGGALVLASRRTRRAGARHVSPAG
jgi:hypothetical protein